MAMVSDSATNLFDNTDLLEGIHIIDTDTHLSEPEDLWTSRAPARYRDKVPRVVDGPKGRRHWVIDDDISIAASAAASVVDLDGTKMYGLEFMKRSVDTVHAASYDPAARVEMMDHLGVYAQILYPNVAGFGNQNFLKVADEELRIVSVQLYNDHIAEMQELSGDRIFGMALMPWWDIEASVAEARRCHAMGLRGVVTCSNPEEAGLDDLGTATWNPFWEVCTELSLPVNFHIGSSKGNMDFFGRAPWPSFGSETKLAVGSANLFMGNCRVVGNLIYSGVPERFPEVKFVSVESGIGWIPFFLEALDHQVHETMPNERSHLSMLPSEYFRRQFYGCFWFETVAIKHLLDVIGVGNVLFETDFPHPTCLYPRTDGRVREALEDLDFTTRKRILQDNAQELYRIPVPRA